MILERQKYRAEIFKILGIALLTPLGRFVLNTLETGLEISFQTFVNASGSFALFIIGIIFLEIGYQEVIK